MRFKQYINYALWPYDALGAVRYDQLHATKGVIPMSRQTEILCSLALTVSVGISAMHQWQKARPNCFHLYFVEDKSKGNDDSY